MRGRNVSWKETDTEAQDRAAQRYGGWANTQTRLRYGEVTYEEVYPQKTVRGLVVSEPVKTPHPASDSRYEWSVLVALEGGPIVEKNPTELKLED